MSRIRPVDRPDCRAGHTPYPLHMPAVISISFTIAFFDCTNSGTIDVIQWVACIFNFRPEIANPTSKDQYSVATSAGRLCVFNVRPRSVHMVPSQPLQGSRNNNFPVSGPRTMFAWGSDIRLYSHSNDVLLCHLLQIVLRLYVDHSCQHWLCDLYVSKSILRYSIWHCPQEDSAPLLR